MAHSGQQVIDQAYDELEVEVPAPIARALRWLRAPERRWLRISAGLLFIAGSFLWFLPVLGLELLPIGLLLLAQDVPFLRKPIGRGILWLVGRWRALKDWWHAKRAKHSEP